jgi:LPXTG-motif cell wall-anchored protein
MKRFVLALIVVVALAAPRAILADDEIICPQPYGGGVVCGVHTPVNTGVGDNLPAAGAGLLLASGVALFLSKKFRVSA